MERTLSSDVFVKLLNNQLRQCVRLNRAFQLRNEEPVLLMAVEIVGYIVSRHCSVDRASYIGMPYYYSSRIKLTTSKDVASLFSLLFPNTVDDGTALISCHRWKQAHEVALPEALSLGTLVLCRGAIREYHNEITINVKDLLPLDDPNAQTLHILDAIHSYQYLLSTPQPQQQQQQQSSRTVQTRRM
jgi:hypothetical protein